MATGLSAGLTRGWMSTTKSRCLGCDKDETVKKITHLIVANITSLNKQRHLPAVKRIRKNKTNEKFIIV
jgi:hypothetical protein